MEIRIIFPQTASRSVHLFCTARRYAQQTDTQTKCDMCSNKPHQCDAA